MHENIHQTKTVTTGAMVPVLYRVEHYIKEDYDTFTLQLGPAGMEVNGQASDVAGQNFAPGQFNMLYVFGMGEAPISISGLAGDGPLTHTTRAVGAVTKAMAALAVGDMIGVRGPFGSQWPVEQARDKDVVLVAGGIGLAPLRPVIRAILANRGSFGRVTVLYGTRSPDDVIFKDELKKWKSLPGLDFYITVDKGTKSWRGSVGVVTKLIPQISFNPANTVAMICGPEIMMHFTIDALQQRGLGGTDIYVSMERNMKCAVGFCGHCQFGPHFICKDGPVFTYNQLSPIFRKHEI